MRLGARRSECASRRCATERSDIDLIVYVDRPHEELVPFRETLVAAFGDPAAHRKIAQHGHSYADVLLLRDAAVWLDVMFFATTER